MGNEDSGAPSPGSGVEHNSPIPTLSYHLDGTPNPPTPPDEPVAPNPQRKGKVTELKMAFERSLHLVRKRQTTKSGEEGAGREAVAKGPRARRPVKATDTSSTDDPSKGSIFCSPLPTTFRRVPNAPSSALKDKISIFEGLVKPTSSSPFIPGHNRGNGDTAFLTGDKILEGESNEPTSTLRDYLAEARGSEHGSIQRVSDADTPNFLRRLSSTFKQKQKVSRKHYAGTRRSRAGQGAEETNQHRSLVSQQAAINPSQSVKRHISAADSLRQRLESELRPDASANGTVEAHAEEPVGGKQRHVAATRPQCQQENEKPFIADTRRKSTLWNIENPFDIPKAKDRSKSEAIGGRLKTSGDRCSGHTETNNFSKVALARMSSSRATPRQKSSAPPFHELTGMAQLRETQSNGRTSSTSGQWKDGSGQIVSSDFVVVANAECELTHPRPSRSSERKMIKVLCECGREAGEERQNGGQDSTGSGSEGSTASFHTAPVTTSAR